MDSNLDISSMWGGIMRQNEMKLSKGNWNWNCLRKPKSVKQWRNSTSSLPNADSSADNTCNKNVIAQRKTSSATMCESTIQAGCKCDTHIKFIWLKDSDSPTSPMLQRTCYMCSLLFFHYHFTPFSLPQTDTQAFIHRHTVHTLGLNLAESCKQLHNSYHLIQHVKSAHGPL